MRADFHEEFATFAHSCQPRLLRVAYLICGDANLAQDLLQSALVKVALRWAQLRDGAPEAYARTVLYRDAVSWWRRWRREVTVAVTPEVRAAPPGAHRHTATRRPGARGGRMGTRGHATT